MATWEIFISKDEAAKHENTEKGPKLHLPSHLLGTNWLLCQPIVAPGIMFHAHAVDGMGTLTSHPGFGF